MNSEMRAMVCFRCSDIGTVSPDFSPGDAMTNRQDSRFARRQPPIGLRPGMGAMNAPDFLRQRVPATESIAVAMVEEARARWRKKDKQGRIKRSLF